MDDQNAWKCPWSICIHEQAQVCHADVRKGCGARFGNTTTSEHAREMVEEDNKRFNEAQLLGNRRHS